MKTLLTILLLLLTSIAYSCPLHINHTQSTVLYDINSRNSLDNTGVNKDGLEFFVEAYNSETTIMYIFNKEGICITQYTFYKYIQLENIKQQLNSLLVISDSMYINTKGKIVFELKSNKEEDYVVIINYSIQ